MEQTYEDVIKVATRELEGISTSARLDVELLLALALETDRTNLHARLDQNITTEEFNRFRVFLERRKLSEPLSYILNKKEFYGLDFIVNRSVLIPRPESELLIEKSLEFLKTLPEGEINILDLGTGSGCLSIVLARQLNDLAKDFEILAVDSSGEALEVAAENALKHGVASDVIFLEGSWFSELDYQEDQFDLIISNPPYVSTRATNLPKELSFEPKEALYAGSSGMDDIEQLMRQAAYFLKPNGRFFCEIGEDQREPITKFFSYVNTYLEKPYTELNFFQDLAGKDRVMELKI